MRTFFTSLPFLVLLIFNSQLNAQSILINPAAAAESALNAEDLTREVLISGGACSEISNFQVKQNPLAMFPNVNRSWGYFEKGNSLFPFEKGIVLTSGYAKAADGPDSGIVSDGDSNWTGDANANVLAGGTTNNATVFEFDFVPYGNEIAFNYIFASEEYPNFACSSFNDVFGFIISGPGIVNDPGLPGKNIARLPNGLPVTINNVNDQGCGDINYYVAGNFPYIEHGGRTTVLTAQSAVVPGETYHIRLLIADTFDNAFDSAVFLEAGSFNLGTSIIDIEGLEIEDGHVICDQTSYTLIANVANPNATFQWSFNGQAIPGATNNQYEATQTGNYSVLVMSAECSTELDVDLVFGSAPIANDYSKLQCSDSGNYVFDLTEFNDDISTTPGAIFTYYTSQMGAQTANPAEQITNFQNYPVTGTVTVYVRIQSPESCFQVKSLILEVGIGPETTPDDYSICDENGDGVSTFDLTSQNADLVVTNPAGLTFEYYLDAAATQPIANPTNFNNTTNPQIVYVKIFNPAQGNGACEKIETLTLKVDEFPELQADVFDICDNLHDGTETIDLTQNEIVVSQGINVNLHYFTEIGGVEIADPQNYVVTTSPTVIHVLVRNTAATCEDYQTITINMTESPDAIDQVVNLENCSLTDFTTFHLPDANELLVNNVNGLTFTYHTTFDNAFNEVNPLPNDYQNTSPNQIVFVRVENINGCFDIGQIQLTAVLNHQQIQNGLEVCDDPYVVSDGVATFDLSQMHTAVENILGGTNFSIVYFTSLQDAANGTNPIQNPTNFQNTANPQTIYAQAVSNTGGCAGIADFRVEVLAVPEFDLKETITFCDTDLDKTFEFGGIFSTYTWYDPNGNVIGNNSTVTFTQPGIHTLEITSPNFECPARRDIEVIFDTAPVITQIDVDGNTVTVYASGGFGPYEYSYTNGLIWHDFNVIHNVMTGIYDMIVKSKYGCVSQSKMFGVLGVPNFISPNGDGINDTWEIRALEAYPNATLKIFDRYGKMFVDRKLENGYQWDGKYMGRQVASGDYWYIITLDNGKMVSGHISVRNR